jgi:hypothetical protein
MDRRRQQKTDSNQLILAALIAALIGIGAQKNVAEGFAKEYMERNGIPSQVELESYIEEVVNQYLDSPNSTLEQAQESKPPDIRVFDCGDYGIFRALIKRIPSDGDCFMLSVIAFQQDCLMKGESCPNFQLDPSLLRDQVVRFMRLNQLNTTMCSGISLLQFFTLNYGPDVPSSSRRMLYRSGQSSPKEGCFYVDHLQSYLYEMNKPGTHVDEAFIAAFAMMFQLRVQVLTQALSEARPVKSMDNPNLEALIALEVSFEDSQRLLNKYSGDVNQAIDYVLKERKPEPVVDSSKIRWQIQPYGNSEQTIGLVCSFGHYELMLEPLSENYEAEICLPPRKSSACGGVAAFSAQPAPSSRTPSACGGAAAVPAQTSPSCRKQHSARDAAAAVSHQPLPSFGYTQEVPGWIKQFKGFFPRFSIDFLLQHMVMPSGKYQTTDEDLKKNAILLSSIEFDALRMFESLDSAFLYVAPNLNGHEFQNVHSIVASFPIGQQMFRCTAVVFNDDHVIASNPDLKHLENGNPKRDQLRKEFYAAIDAHFQKNPRVVIDKMLIEPCA